MSLNDFLFGVQGKDVVVSVRGYINMFVVVQNLTCVNGENKIYIGHHNDEYYNLIFDKRNIQDVYISKDECDNYEMCIFTVIEKNTKLEIEIMV